MNAEIVKMQTEENEISKLKETLMKLVNECKVRKIVFVKISSNKKLIRIEVEADNTVIYESDITKISEERFEKISEDLRDVFETIAIKVRERFENAIMQAFKKLNKNYDFEISDGVIEIFNEENEKIAHVFLFDYFEETVANFKIEKDVIYCNNYEFHYEFEEDKEEVVLIEKLVNEYLNSNTK